MSKSYCVVTSDLQHAAANKHEQRKRAVAKVIPQLCEFLSTCRKIGVPIIHLRLVVPPGDPRSNGLPSELQFEEGSTGAEMLPECLGPGDMVMDKPKDSGFFKTSLDETLRARGVDTLILVGMQAQICIQTTAADAHFRDFGVVVPRDGIISSSEDDVIRALAWLKDYCAEISDLQSLASRLRAQANGASQ